MESPRLPDRAHAAPVGGNYREVWDMSSKDGSLCFASAILSRLVGGVLDEADVQWLAAYLRANIPQRQPAAGEKVTQPVPVAERPWERDGWCDEHGQCWMGRPLPDAPTRWDWSSAVTDDNATHCLPHDIPALPAMFAGLPLPSGESAASCAGEPAASAAMSPSTGSRSMTDLSPAAQAVLDAITEICPAPADDIAAAALRAAADQVVPREPAWASDAYRQRADTRAYLLAIAAELEGITDKNTVHNTEKK